MTRKRFNKLLKKYSFWKKLLELKQLKYETAKKAVRTFAEADNQLGFHNKLFMPPYTKISKNELRKQLAAECLKAKNDLKETQKLFEEKRNSIEKEFIEHGIIII